MSDLGAGFDEDDRPIGELIGRLLQDGKAYAQAEANLARAKVETRVEKEVVRFRRPVLYGAVAAAFALAGVIALVMTLVLSLASVLGPLAGGLLATLAALLIALGFGLAAKRSLGVKP